MIIFAGARSPQGSHFLQAFFLPLLYTSFLALTAQRYLPLPWGLWVEMGVLALVATLTSAGLQRRRQQTWAPYYLAGLGVVLLYVLNGWLFTGSFALSGILVVTWLFSLFQVFASAWFARQLTGRARLWYHLRSYEGEELRVHARDFQEEANFTPANKMALTSYLRLMTLLAMAAVLGVWGPAYYGLLGFWWVLLISMEGLYRSYRTEMEFYSLGHRISLPWSALRLATGLALALGAWSAASAVADFVPHISWGVSSYTPAPPAPEPVPVERAPIMPSSPISDTALPQWLLFLPRIFGPIWNGLLAFFASWGIPILALLLIVIPGLRLLRALRLRPRALRLALLRRWFGFLDFFRRLWAAFRRKPPPEPLFVALSNREAWLQESRAARAAQKKSRHPSSPLVQGFLLLLDLGEELRVVYRRGSTTAEYLLQLSYELPDQTTLLAKISSLLDAGFFSGRSLSHEERKTWTRLMRLVLDAGRKARHNSDHDHRTKNP